MFCFGFLSEMFCQVQDGLYLNIYSMDWHKLNQKINLNDSDPLTFIPQPVLGQITICLLILIYNQIPAAWWLGG